MRLSGRQLDLSSPRVGLLGCLLLFYLFWVCATVWRAPPVPQNAYATFLSEPYVKEGENATEVQDSYFLGTRVMIHRLLHSEVRGKYAVVVMVTDGVSLEKRQRLEKDGARVIAVSTIEAQPWMQPNEPRWHNMLTKLKLFDLTEYERICYMDSDILIMSNLDLIFETEAVEEQKTRDSASLAGDELPLPQTYVMAAHADSYGYTHPFTYPDYLNAGFVVFKPSRVLYDYYISVSKIEGRYKTGMMEQDLLNYAHRRYGNMPWKQLWEKWNIDHPVDEDFDAGVLTFHDKFWEYSTERSPRATALWNQHLGEMRGYWRVIEQGAAAKQGPNKWMKWS